MSPRTSAVFALAVSAWLVPALPAAELSLIPVATGLTDPVFVTAPPGDSSRIFVVEQSGTVRIVTGGSVLPVPYLDIRDRVSYGGEQGLLGMAFHPEYASNGWVFVNYTNRRGDTRIERYTVSSDPNVVDPSSAVTILTIGQPFPNHNGGCLAFGPDGMLYIGTGDGGFAGDPFNNAQDVESLLGKMLRIDVSHGEPYAIPADNPFVGRPGRDEIWAVGLRNPWRYSFDRGTGDLYIADVGQDEWEEIDIQPSQSTGGENYGWRRMEGSHCYRPPADCDDGTLFLPQYEYAHSSGRCSVTGGYVYRGSRMPWLHGAYFFADYCTGEVWSFRYIGGQVTDFRDWTADLRGAGLQLPSSFGEDAEGELYITDLAGGEVFLFTPVLNLSLTPLVGGAPATARVERARPESRVYLAYSLTGPGETPVPPLGVTLDLDRPALAAVIPTDTEGTGEATAVVPEALAGRTIHLQAAEWRAKSEVVVDTVESPAPARALARLRVTIDHDCRVRGTNEAPLESGKSPEGRAPK